MRSLLTHKANNSPIPRILGDEYANFNEFVLIDVMQIDSLPVLHSIDEATHFYSAGFIPNSSTESI